MSVAADALLSVAASHLRTMSSRLEACSDAEPGLFQTRRIVDNVYLFISRIESREKVKDLTGSILQTVL